MSAYRHYHVKDLQRLNAKLRQEIYWTLSKIESLSGVEQSDSQSLEMLMSFIKRISTTMKICDTYYEYTKGMRVDKDLTFVEYWSVYRFFSEADSFLSALTPTRISTSEREIVTGILFVVDDVCSSNEGASLKLVYQNLETFYKENGYLLLDIPLE